ncbi:hypothetical protein P5629_04480 [Bacillus subtilis]|nr:hypothetical protein P5629_04480 [Bacillus subtilis]
MDTKSIKDVELQALTLEEAEQIDGGSYAKYLGTSVVTGTGAGVVGGVPGVILGAHAGAIAGSVGYLGGSLIAGKWL